YSLGAQHLNIVRGTDGHDPFRNSSLQGSLEGRPTTSSSLSARIWTGDSFTAINDSPYAAPAGQLPPGGTIRAVPVSRQVQRMIENGEPFEYGSANFVPNLNDPDSRRASRFLSGALRFTHNLAPGASYRLSYQRVTTRRLFGDGPAGVVFEPPFSTFDRIGGGIDTVQARTDLQLARWNLLSGGYEFERESYSNLHWADAAEVSLSERYSADTSQRSHSAFFHNQSTLLGDRLHVSLSGRVQSFDLGSPHFTGGIAPYRDVRFTSPRAARTGDAALAYFMPSTGTKLRAHIGNGYRAPSIYERLGAIFFNGTFSALGDPRLSPDRTVAFDWGIDQYLLGQKLRVSATHYYTNLQEVIAFDSSGFINPATDPFGRTGGYFNTGGGIARGVELTVEASPARSSRVFASYTYTNADQRNSTVRDNDYFKQVFISDHQFTLVATQRLTRRLDVAFDLWVVSEHPALLSRRAFLFPGARKADLGGSYTVPLADGSSLRVSGKINNLFGSTYFENGFRAPGIWSTGGIALLF
ncbi:MAG: TonB-dependent receptor domain-containing protein, partial [Bryobacteraceae bacterium]